MGPLLQGAPPIDVLTSTLTARGDLVRRSATAPERVALGTALALLKSDGTDAVWGTAGQIAFPATANPSADANTLDDYEEGTWTPVLTFATPGNLTVAYSTQAGWYEKIGRFVVVHCALVLSTFTHTTASGNLLITGLPFTATAAVSPNSMRAGGIQWGGITKANFTDMVPTAEDGSTNISVRASGSGQAAANVTAADMPTAGAVQIRLGVFYSS